MADAKPRSGKDPVFVKRVVSAIVLAPVAVLVVWAGGYGFAIFCAAFAAAMAWEWVRMSDPAAPPRAYALATSIAVGGALLSAQGAYGWAAFWIVAGAGLSALDRRMRGSMPRAFFGQGYISVSVACLIAVRNGAEGGMAAAFFLLAVVWAADICAYLAGTWLGGPKLLPHISPNKTWTGLIAGLAAGTAAGAAVGAWLGFDPVNAALIALPAALAAVAGDLIVSLAKRRFGVKDAGTIIPGHGGVLDRVDALMLAAIFAAAVIAMNPQVWPGAGA